MKKIFDMGRNMTIDQINVKIDDIAERANKKVDDLIQRTFETAYKDLDRVTGMNMGAEGSFGFSPFRDPSIIIWERLEDAQHEAVRKAAGGAPGPPGIIDLGRGDYRDATGDVEREDRMLGDGPPKEKE